LLGKLINISKIFRKEMEDVIRKIAIEIALNAKDREEAIAIKKKLAKDYKLQKMPSNVEILKEAKGSDYYRRLREILRLKPVRSLSGVVVIAVMSSPARCPHGKCVPCPGGVEFNSPQSYTGLEPAAMRGKQHEYDPFKQVTSRLRELYEIGHDIDKAEIIVMGGTFIARDDEYKKKFIIGIYNALNCFRSRMKMEENIERAKRKNERAKVRCVGLTFETRPDYAMEEHIIEMLRYGATRVELGVQSIYDDVLEKIKRGHGVEETIKATKLLKDSAFKVCYHVMPGLPGSDLERDLKMFKEIFEREEFKPDYLKIYPTVIVKGTELYEMWKKGEYKPYETEEVVELIAKAKKFIPEWVRIQRIQRDIPVHAAIGLRVGNLRQLVQKRLKELGYSCRCIRCREVGHKGVPEEEYKKAELKITKYRASGGEEIFISYEIPEYDALVGFLRLRFPAEPFIKEIRDCALIREIHVYGKSTPLGEIEAFQHRGFGESMLKVAEEIAKESYDEIAVISAVGVREYYRKFGYRKRFEYMVKRL
jgi:elongator complex protein 3